MFGGAGIYREGVMFALVFDGAIFLKVDEASIPEFEREGSRPFVYTRAKSPGKIGAPRSPIGGCPSAFMTIPKNSPSGPSARSPSRSARKQRRARGQGEAAERCAETVKAPCAAAVVNAMAADKMKIMNFASAPELRAWLAKNHSRSEGILLRLRNAQQDQPLFHRLPLADREETRHARKTHAAIIEKLARGEKFH
jgi:Regulator of competence-specific genes